MKIGDVCSETCFTSSTLRFYEKKGIIRNIKKDKNGIRDYSVEDLRWIKFLSHMKNAGLSLKSMMSYGELYYSKNESFADRLEVTMRCRDGLMFELKQLQEGIEFFDNKIKYYKDKLEKGIEYDES